MAKKSEVDLVTDEKVRNGGILVRFYFDVQDKDREKLQPLLIDLINNRLLKEKGVVYCYGKIDEPIERDGVFLTSAIVTALFDSLSPLFGVIFAYAPAGIEVLKPEHEFNLKVHELQSLLVDMSGVSINYSRYILEKVLSPQDVAEIKKQIENRIEVGKKAMGKSDDAKATGESNLA